MWSPISSFSEILLTQQRKQKKRITFLISYLSSIMFFVIAGVISKLTFFTPQLSFVSIIASLMFFDRFIIELLVVLFISIWLINGHWLLRFIGYILACSFIAINIVQLVAIQRGGEFLSPLAIENINHISLVMTTPNIMSFSVLLVICGFLPYMIEKKFNQKAQTMTLVYTSTLFLILGFSLHYNHLWLPSMIQDQRKSYFIGNNMQHTSPSLSLYHTLLEKDENMLAIKFTPDEIIELKKFGFYLNLQQVYPLIKENIYSNKVVPFMQGQTPAKAPNIIVFFTEGFSARTTNVYASEFPDITPNLSDFSEHSMIVFNYFNHTAATYRGLHGQLCSIYPTYGGVGGWHTNYEDLPNTTYLCLPEILNENSYETIFIDSHRKDSAYVDEMMGLLKFKTVLTAEKLSKDFLNSAEPLRGDSLSDNQFYDAFIGYLRKRENNNQPNKPFFIGLYNLGTHAWLDVPKDGVRYKDGKNNSLNTIHNLDYAFGKFWRYYKTSSYAKDTIIIFTADHAHYAEKSFVSAIKQSGQSKYQKLFVDKIPLIIHDPLRSLPKKYDVGNATSIDFAPSIVHYLGLSNKKNSFLGLSFFDKERKEYNQYGVASIGGSHFLIDNNRIHSVNNSEKHKDKLKLIAKFVKASQQLEVNNFLWKKFPD